jgi:DNA-binding NarL/FixJ family response regulator
VEAGGSGFILKTASSNEYIETIRAVAEGSKVLPPALTNSLFTQIIESALRTGEGIPNNSIQLTAREREVVALISEGLSNKDLAERLHIATYTVKSHIHNILEKLALDTRLQIAAFARREESE